MAKAFASASAPRRRRAAHQSDGPMQAEQARAGWRGAASNAQEQRPCSRDRAAASMRKRSRPV